MSPPRWRRTVTVTPCSSSRFWNCRTRLLGFSGDSATSLSGIRLTCQAFPSAAPPADPPGHRCRLRRRSSRIHKNSASGGLEIPAADIHSRSTPTLRLTGIRRLRVLVIRSMEGNT